MCHVTIKDHPRLRGENPTHILHPISYTGSPPPTRGKHVELQGTNPDIRITPAYAGKTVSALYRRK